MRRLVVHSFLDENFKLKNLRNVQDKHLIAYIEYRKGIGIADKTIKTVLGAIRDICMI